MERENGAEWQGGGPPRGQTKNERASQQGRGKTGTHCGPEGHPRKEAKTGRNEKMTGLARKGRGGSAIRKAERVGKSREILDTDGNRDSAPGLPKRKTTKVVLYESIQILRKKRFESDLSPGCWHAISADNQTGALKPEKENKTQKEEQLRS